MKRIIYILLFAFIWSFLAYSQNTRLTLKESMEIGFKNSKDLIISNSKIIGSKARVEQASSQLLPQLKLSAGYTRLSSVPPFVISIPLFPNPIEVAPVFLDNYNLHLSLQQPLFTGFRLSSLRNAAEYNRSAAEEDMVRDKNEVAMNIQTAYWNFYRAKIMKNLIDENVKQAQKHVEDTRNLLENGLATRNDLLKLEVQYSNAKLQQIDANNNLDLARVSFNKTIGLPLGEKTDIDTIGIQISREKFDLQEMLSEAKNNRSELKSLNLRIDAGKENIDALRSGWFPSVSLIGNWYMSKPNSRIQPPEDIFKGTWDVGILLSWDLWNWGNTGSQTKESQQIVIQSRTSYEQMKDAIELEVNQNYLSLIYAGEKIAVSREAIDQAEENYRSTQDKYKEQMATSTDLIDAENSVLQARTNYSNALIDYQLGKVKLEKSAGRPIYKY
jgi:outer membrane protein